MSEKGLRFLRRFVALSVGFAAAWLSIAALLHALGLSPPLQYASSSFSFLLDLSDAPAPVRLAWGSGMAVVCMASLLLIWLGFTRSKEDRVKRVVLRNSGLNGFPGNGQVTYALESLRNLVAHTLEQDPDIREAHPKVRMKKHGIMLDCRLMLNPRAQLPDVLGRVRPLLRDVVESHTGIPVEQMNFDAQLSPVRTNNRVA